jgi:hypothetical protein
MKRKFILIIGSMLLSLSVLAACNVDNSDMVDPQDVNFEPVRYDRNNDREMDMRNNDLNDGGTDLNNGNNFDNRGNYLDNRDTNLDLNTDPESVRDQNERDTPFNMDEEEPDLDEEPSEERRGQ